jgi:lysophospholipase L1-like esterase
MKVMSRVALVVSSVVLVGWSAAGCGSSSSPKAGVSQGSPSSATSSRPLSLVVIGDSIPYNSPDDCAGCVGFAAQYAEALGQAMHRTVMTSNLSEHVGLTLPMLLRELPSLKKQLSSADAILVGIAHNSIELNADRPCGSRVVDSGTTFADWSKLDRSCARRSTDRFRPLYDRLFSTIAAWRRGKPTVLRTIDKYNDWIGWKPAHLTADQASTVVMFHRLWNRMLCASARAHHFECADINRAFNGPRGDRASGDLLGPDYTHPSQKGNDLIAKTLVAQGFAPLAPSTGESQ